MQKGKQTDPAQVPLERLPKKTLPPLAGLMVPVTSVLSGALVTLAFPELIGADGFIDYVKCGVIGAGATFITLSVNRFAIEKGAFQAAIGSLSAGAVSTTTILLVGTAMSTATYHGFVKSEADRLRLQEYNTAYTAWLQERANSAQNGVQAAPVLRAIIADLEDKAACEVTSSCVSGVGNGGRGTAFRTLSGAHGNAVSVLEQLGAADNNRGQALAHISDLQRQMQSALTDNGLSQDQRRVIFRDLSGRAARTVSDLEGQSPVSLLAAFAGGLMEQDGAAPQNRYLAAHGAQLASVLKGPQPQTISAPPVFPMSTGVTDTLRFIPYFLPIALLVAMCDLILPMALWLYAFIDLRARLDEQERKRAVPARRRTSPKAR